MKKPPDKIYKKVKGIGFKNKIAKWWRELEYPALTGRIFIINEHRGAWGNNVETIGSALVGHLPDIDRMIAPGDEVRCETQSGRLGQYVVLCVKKFHDPPDMFKAPLGLFDYIENGG
jgi:hypothetical protein